MFTEDLSVFFDTTTGFAVVATWGALTSNVIFDAPSENILGGQVNSEEYLATLKNADFPNITRGATVMIGGATYKVRNVNTLSDGSLKTLSLAKP